MTKNNTHIAKPFLKWAGGKTQLLTTFEGYYPTPLQEKASIDYHEPFLGGGAVFFHLAQHYAIRSAYLYDINQELILTYRVVQEKVDDLLEYLYSLEKTYLALDDTQRTVFYYETRKAYNEERLLINYNKLNTLWVARAAKMIFLNKTCFNGLVRFNSKGEFNTPAGKYKNPTICDEQNLQLVSGLLGNANIINAPYKEVEQHLSSSPAFVYFDPPYRPISDTSSFKSYSKHPFNDEDQIALANLYTQLHEKGHYLMLSNSDPKNENKNDDFFDELYAPHHIYRVPAKRMINSKASSRGDINELLVCSYPFKKQPS